MATDFNYNNKTIDSSGPIKPSGTDQPGDPRTRVDFYSDIESIPNPYIGMIVTVKMDETNQNKMTDYKVLSLKANTLGIANSVIDRVQKYSEYLGVNTGGSVDLSGYATKDELNSKANTSDIPTNTSELNNDSGFLTSIPSEYVTETEMNEAIANISSSGGVSQEDISTAVNNYLTEHPVTGGATTEQANQIEANKTNISTLKELVGDSSSGLVNSISGIKDSVRPDKFYSCFKATDTTAEGGDTNTTITNIDKRFFEFNVALTDPVQSYIYACIKLCNNADINDYVGHKKVNLFFQTTATGIITVCISKKGNWSSAAKLLNQVEVDGDATKTHVVNLDLTCQEITDYFAYNVNELNILLIYKGYSSANAFSADSVTKGFIVYDDIDTELTSNTGVVNIAKQALVAEELSTKGKEDINNTINDVINNKPIGLDYITSNRFKVANNVSITMSSSGKVVTVKKVAGTTGEEINKYPKVYITIPCNNITDLDVDISLNLEKIAGNTEFNTFKICKSESDWALSNLPIDFNAFQPFNPYRLIQNSKFATDYASANSITLIMSYYASNSSTTDYANKTFEYQFNAPTIGTTQIVLANELSSNLRKELNADKYITCWGDSLTAMGGWTSTLSELSGLPVYNAGTGGESVNTIVARQGADAMIINNITIPADTTAVQLTDFATAFTTFFGKKASPLKQGGSSHVNPCYIGDVKGTLAFTGSNHNDETGVWTFTRLEAGEEVVINRPTPIRTNFDMNYNAPAIMIIFMGQNGGHDSTEDLIERHRLMIEHSKCKDFLILGLSSGTSTSLADYEAKMKAEFGRRFLSLRQYLSVYGLEDAGIEPTEQDIADMAEGKTPTSLRSDSVHYNSYGKEVIGKLVYKTVRDLNML